MTFWLSFLIGSWPAHRLHLKQLYVSERLLSEYSSCYTKRMQPDRTPSQWRQPDEQPSQAPYVAPPSEQPVGPVVTLSPGEVPAGTPWQPATSVTESPAVDPAEKTAEPDMNPALAPVRWQATEYIHRDKTPVWFVIFGLVCVVLIGLAVLVIKSITFAVLIPVMAAALLVYSHRPPRVIDYTLSRQGLHINDHLYPFGEFKSFGVIHGDDEYSVFLVPTKRFKPGVSVYFPEEAGEAIVDMLAARLPMRELRLDAVDRIIRKLRL